MVILLHGETNVTFACSNSCASCNHFAPIREPWHALPADIDRDLILAAKVMHFEQYALIGGEPTLHPKLLEIIDIIRRSGITDRIQLATNGQNAERWSDELYKAIDDLQVTPYKLSEAERFCLMRKCRKHNVVLQWQPFDVFNFVAYKRPHSAERAAELYCACWYRKLRQVIDGGYFYRCCLGRHIPEMLLGLPREDDAIALKGLTEEKLLTYLAQTETPRACYICGACNQAPEFAWYEQPDRAKWLEESLA